MTLLDAVGWQRGCPGGQNSSGPWQRCDMDNLPKAPFSPSLGSPLHSLPAPCPTSPRPYCWSIASTDTSFPLLSPVHGISPILPHLDLCSLKELQCNTRLLIALTYVKYAYHQSSTQRVILLVEILGARLDQWERYLWRRKSFSDSPIMPHR